MGFMFPYSATMRVFAGLILLSVLVNTILFTRTDWGSQWLWDWSPIILFVGILLLTGSLWQDPRIVIFVSGVIAILWYVFIVLGWSW